MESGEAFDQFKISQLASFEKSRNKSEDVLWGPPHRLEGGLHPYYLFQECNPQEMMGAAGRCITLASLKKKTGVILGI